MMQYNEFMEAGFRVFPLWGFDDTRCFCSKNGCSAPGKHPRSTNWQHTPENDPEHIKEMEDQGLFASGYGVLCKGLLVVDVDARNGGVASYEKLLKDIPEIAGAGMIVETGSGGGSKHLYFSLDMSRSLVTHLADYPGIDFKSSGFVVGPGSRHASGNPYKAVDGTPYDIDKAPEALLVKLTKPERKRLEYDGHQIDVSQKDLLEILEYIPNNDCHYDDWVKIGMAIHHSTAGAGYLIWDHWSERSSKYDDGDMEKKWHSFGKASNPVTIGTLIHEAKKNGWKVPLAYYPAEAPTVEDDEPEQKSGMPFDVSGIDLNSPPGTTGAIATWIESQSRRPRKRMSVASALVAMGNIIGLRYKDVRDGVTANIFAFCIAGSRTGKESANQAIIEIHHTAGLSAATHGGVKSEQEVIRNLMDHQAAFYVMDEIGITLQKIRNAQKRGGAVYLEGVIGMFMSAYSKANGYLPVSGDVMRDLKSTVSKEISQLEKADDGSEWRQERIAQLLEFLNSPSPGLKNPYLSIIGYTTPVTFDQVVDFESATNGFIGRSLLFNERDTAPRSKETKGFMKPEMPMGLKMSIMSIAYGGDSDLDGSRRVEYPARAIPVETDIAADAMLEAALIWFEDKAIAHKSTSGLESLYLGAYELVAKVSFILAAPERLRTAEHVRWAFELVRRDVEEKIRLVTVNDREADAPEAALAARIANLCGGEKGETMGVIYNRTRNRKREDIDMVVEKMVKAGTLVRIGTTQKGTGRVKFVGDD